MQAYSRVYGTGFVVGEQLITNDDMAKVIDTSDEWIRERSGIRQRYWVDGDTATSDLGVRAAHKALEDAKLKPSDIDYVVVATMTPDYYFPGLGSQIQHKLGMGHTPALDLRQQCSGFVYGLQVCDALIRAGAAKRLLFVGAEIHSGFMPFSHNAWEMLHGRSTTPIPAEEKEFYNRFRHLMVLFGDAAGALVMGPTDDPKRGVLGFKVYSDGSNVENLYVPSAGMKQRPYFKAEDVTSGKGMPFMEGKAVFRQAVTKIPEAILEVCKHVGVSLADVNMLIPHQANLRINEAVQKALKLPDDRVYNNIERYGNTTAATIPIAYDECRKSGKVKQGDLVCFTGLGAGFHWGAALMRE